MRIFGAVCVFLLWGNSLFAMAIGGEALDLFEVSFSASDMALSEATAAKAKNPFGGFYNPATLPLQRQVSLYSSQGKMSDQVDVFSLTTLFCVWELPMSLTWVQIQAGKIPLVASANVGQNTDIDPDAFAHYGAQGVVAATSVSIAKDWFLGLSLIGYMKSLSSVAEGQAYGYSLTPGISGALGSEWTVGMYFRNLFSQEKWATASQGQFLPEWHMGLSYQNGFLALLGEWVLLPKSSYAGYGKLGAVVSFGDMVFLRGGYQATHVTAGLGLHVGAVSVDYVFVGSSTMRFGESSRFSIGVLL